MKEENDRQKLRINKWKNQPQKQLCYLIINNNYNNAKMHMELTIRRELISIIELWGTREVCGARKKCKVAWDAAESNSRFLSALQTSQVNHNTMMHS